MARIVMVHGAFNELWGPNEIAARWVPALRDGLWHHDATVADEDVAVCFYGDLFRRRPGVDDHQLVQARAMVEARMTDDGGPMLARMREEMGQAMVGRTLDLIAAIVADPSLAGRVQERLERTITPETRVVVSHSLGTIVAHRALTAHPEWAVHTFVTLGSPLGSPSLPANAGGHHVGWPGSVQRWVNVAAEGDPVADPSALAPVIDARIEDHLVSNGARAHDPEPYLNADVTGAAVAAALAVR